MHVHQGNPTCRVASCSHSRVNDQGRNFPLLKKTSSTSQREYEDGWQHNKYFYTQQGFPSCSIYKDAHIIVHPRKCR